MPWSTDETDEFMTWFSRLSEVDQDHILAAVDVLTDRGPALGAPLVKPIKKQTRSTMRELRPASQGASELRVLFAWDTRRQAILLLGGDKSGNWTGWYDTNIPRADDLYDSFIQKRDEKEAREGKAPSAPVKKRRKGGGRR